MVTLDAPAPRQAAWRAEDRHAVVLGMAVEALVVLDQAERLLQAHDVDGLLVPGLAQRMTQQVVQRGFGRSAHRLDRQTRTIPGHVVPVEPLLLVEGPEGPPALLLAQAFDEGRDQIRHGRTRGAPPRPGLRQRRGAHQGRSSRMHVASAHGVPPLTDGIRLGRFGRDRNPKGPLTRSARSPRAADRSGPRLLGGSGAR